MLPLCGKVFPHLIDLRLKSSILKENVRPLLSGSALHTRTVQEHLGHTTLAMTQRYSHLSRDFRRQEIQCLNGLCDESSKKLVRNDQMTNVEVQPNVHATA